MTRAKNSTTDQVVQVATTKAQPFRQINPSGDQIFQVIPGICVIDALEDASCLLSESLCFITDYADDESGLKISAVWLMQEHLVAAKAALDAAVSGLMKADLVGGGK